MHQSRLKHLYVKQLQDLYSAENGTVATYAQLLGDEQAQELLQATLDEETDTDEKLTELAEATNVDAAETIGDDPEDKSILGKVKAKVTGHS